MCIPKPIFAAALVLALSGCAQTIKTAHTVCDDFAQAQANPIVAAALDAQDLHSAVGVLWADAKVACVAINGVPVPAPSVGNAWISDVWTGLLVAVKAAAPTVLPMILGLL